MCNTLEYTCYGEDTWKAETVLRPNGTGKGQQAYSMVSMMYFPFLLAVRQ